MCEGSASLRRCENCERMFEVSLEQSGKRSHAKHCSDRCRVEAYRRRKDRAVALERKGMPVKDIAKQLDTTVKTARGWLREGRKRTGAKAGIRRS